MISKLPRLAISALALAALTATAFAGPVAAARTTHYVDDDGLAGPSGCDGTNLAPTTVQGGVDAASRGDVVIVCPGEYLGPVRILNKPGLVLRAARAWTATLRPALAQDSARPLVAVRRSAGARVQWLNLEFPTGPTCTGLNYGIRVGRSPRTHIRSNHLKATGPATQGDCQYNLGILIDPASRGSKVVWNRVIDFGYGGIAISAPNVVARGNTVYFFHDGYEPTGNEASSYGIATDTTAPGARLIGNVVRGNPDSAALRLSEAFRILSGESLVRENRMHDVREGIHMYIHSGSQVIGNSQSGQAVFGLILSGSDGNTITGNQMLRAIAASDSENNLFDSNNFFASGFLDCWDQSSGSGTGGTANTWTNNIGGGAEPAEICSAP